MISGFITKRFFFATQQGTGENLFSLKDACQAFLLSWKFFNTKILEEFTMENAPSFGNEYYKIIHLLYTQACFDYCIVQD